MRTNPKQSSPRSENLQKRCKYQRKAVVPLGSLNLFKEVRIIENIDSIRLDDQLCFPLYACAKEIVRLYRKPLQALGLTYTQYLVMMLLWENGGMTEGELGKRLHLDSGTLAPLLKRLEKQELIHRSRLESNERKLLLTLTKEGEKLKEKAISVPREMQGCIPLSQKELEILKALLDKALLNMTW